MNAEEVMLEMEMVWTKTWKITKHIRRSTQAFEGIYESMSYIELKRTSSDIEEDISTHISLEEILE